MTEPAEGVEFMEGLRFNQIPEDKFKSWLGKTPTNYQGSYPLGDIVQQPDNFPSIRKFQFVDITKDQ